MQIVGIDSCFLKFCCKGEETNGGAVESRGIFTLENDDMLYSNENYPVEREQLMIPEKKNGTIVGAMSFE